jgi:cytochrome c peroxidase
MRLIWQSKTLLTLGAMVTACLVLPMACRKPATAPPTPTGTPGTSPGDPQLPATPFDYHSVGTMPNYIAGFLQSQPGIDNTPIDNPITDAGATLGRVLFYDKTLSVNNTVACASCHREGSPTGTRCL